MAIIKNAGYVEDLADDATQAQIDEVKRKASAIRVSAKETIAYEETEVMKEQGAAKEAKYKEAGVEESEKLAEGSAEGRVATEMALPPAAGIVANLVESTSEARLNPSKGADIAKAKDKMGAAIVGQGAKSFEDQTKQMKLAPVAGGVRKASGIKTSPIEDSKDGLLARVGLTGDFKTKGVNKIPGQTAQLSTGEVKKSLDIAKAPANEAKLNRAIALEKTAAPAGPGGVGSSAPAMNHDKFGHLTPTKKFLAENDESGTVA